MSNEEQKQQEELLKQLTSEHRERLERLMQVISSMPEDVRKEVVKDETFNDLVKLMIIKELFKDPMKEYIAMRGVINGDGVDPKSLKKMVRREVIKLGLSSPIQQAKAIKQQIKELRDTLNELKDTAGLLDQKDIDKFLDEKLEKLKEDLLSGNVNFKEAVRERLSYQARLMELLIKVVDRIADRAMDAFGDRLVDGLIANLFKGGEEMSSNVFVGGGLEKGGGVDGPHGGEVLNQGNPQVPQQVPSGVAITPAPALGKSEEVSSALAREYLQSRPQLVWEVLESHWQEWSEEDILKALNTRAGREAMKLVAPVLALAIDELGGLNLETAEELDTALEAKLEPLREEKSPEVRNLIQALDAIRENYPHVYSRLLNALLVIVRSVKEEKT